MQAGAPHAGSCSTSSRLREGVWCSSRVPGAGRTPTSGCMASDGSHPAALAVVVIPGSCRNLGIGCVRVCKCVCTWLRLCDQPHVILRNSVWKREWFCLLTRPAFHSVVERTLMQARTGSEFRTRHVAGQSNTLFQPLHLRFCRVENSVHISQCEEPCVNYLLLKSENRGGRMRL